MSALRARVIACLTGGRGSTCGQRIRKAAGAGFANCIQSIAAQSNVAPSPATKSSANQPLATPSFANQSPIPKNSTLKSSAPAFAAAILLLTFLAATSHAYEAAIYTRRIGINVTPTTALEVSGTVSATRFVGDGSGLTGISATAANVSVTTGASGSLVYRDQNGSLFSSSNYYVSNTNIIIGTPYSWMGASNNALWVSNGVFTDGGYRLGNVQSVYWGTTSNAAISGDASLNHLAFKTSNTEALRIVSTGYVGIGTTAPAGPLDVSGTNGRMYLDSTGSSLTFTRSGDNSIRAAATGGKIGLYTNNNTRLLVDSSGNVGIGTGTLSASSTLHISGTARITSWTYIGDNITPTAPLEVSGTVSATRFVGDGSGLTGISATAANVSVTTGASGSIVFRDQFGSLFATSNLSVSSTTGSVGIGAGAPAWLGSNAVYASGSLFANALYTNGTSAITWGSGNTKIAGSEAPGYLAFTTSGTEAMRIVSTGYVGIGTTSCAFRGIVSTDFRAS